MLTGHTGMHVSVRDFGAGIVDVLKALESIGVGDSVVDENKIAGVCKSAKQNRLISKERVDMKVTWNEAVCIHAGKCVAGSPEVFKVEDGQFKIDLAAGEESQVRATVAECPSGALQIEED